jgi:hypothetical protein
MFINFNTFRKLKLTEEFVFFLLAVKSEDEHYIENFKDKQKSLEEGYIKQIKSGDYRLDKKGKDVLNKLSKSDSITPETEKLAEWIANYYKNKKGGIVRNKKELQRRCQSFSDETGWVKNQLAVVVASFINDTYDQSSGLSLEEFKEQNPRMQLSMLAENLFWVPRSKFSTHFNLDDSPLYQYYLEHTKHIEEQWKKNGVEI